MTTVLTLWRHLGPCSIKNLPGRCLRASGNHRQDLSGVTVLDHGHIPVAFSDRGLVYQQQPAFLTAPPCPDQSGPVSDRIYDQMPTHPVAAGNRRNRHHLGILDQAAAPTGESYHPRTGHGFPCAASPQLSHTNRRWVHNSPVRRPLPLIGNQVRVPAQIGNPGHNRGSPPVRHL